MTSRKSNLIKSFLVLGLCSILPINIAKANFWDKLVDTKFLGKWCVSRIITIMGEQKISLNDRSKNCFTFKRGGVLIAITEAGSAKSSYEVLDEENILIIPPNGKQSTIKYDKNTREMKVVANWSGDLYGYTETYLTKE